jgi:long-chain acyl-CoA synthetase
MLHTAMSFDGVKLLLDRMREHAGSLAVAWRENECSYGELLAQYHHWCETLAQRGVLPGDVIALEVDDAGPAIAALLACALRRTIIVPLSSSSRSQHDQFRATAAAQWRVWCSDGVPTCERIRASADLPLYGRLREAGHPGLVLFTSGSTGASKAAVHDLELLLDKFRDRRKCLRTILFLQLDHIGGINTLLYTLSNGGAVVFPEDRSPAKVCHAIARFRVELLPTSPTFLNLLLLSGEHARHDLSSLRLITYGTEPMPQSTLARLAAAFPSLQFQQTYGLTELGILRSRSRDSNSLWVQVGGDGFETKVVDGRLWIRARSAMLGYLNAPSPFDSEGFLDTGDRVEVDGQWLRILGRQSEIINVGGNKVYPAEVESVLLEMEGVVDASVCGEAHSLMGQLVTARICLAGSEDPRDFRVRMRQFCQDKLPAFSIPSRISFSNEALYNSRFKRLRRTNSE